jgi:hypothetical protein
VLAHQSNATIALVEAVKAHTLPDTDSSDAQREVVDVAEAYLDTLAGRLGTLAEDLPQEVELDCNLVKVSATGAVIVDARVRIAPAEAPRPLGARR